MKLYWQFYWPLALTGAGLVLSVQFQNAVLGRYPEAVKELAILALAYSIYGFFNASLGFVSQLTNVYARSKIATDKTRRFVLISSILIVIPLLVISSTTFGSFLISNAFQVDNQIVEQIRKYLFLLCPLVLLNAQRHFYTGLLVQAKLTGWITVLNFIYLSAVVIALVVGFSLGLEPRYVVVGSELIGVSLLLCGLFSVKILQYRLPSKKEHEDVSYRQLTRFFLPVSTTGIMFALSRPVLYAFVSRSENSILTIAALRVAFDFTMLFQQAANQFRHFFISFGAEDLEQKVHFMRAIAFGITAIMLLFVLTPLSGLVWGDLMSLPPELRSIASEVVLIMCLMPGVIVYRNYFHSMLMMRQKTYGMALGSILRVLGIYLTALLIFKAGSLNHVSATCILLFGFVIEAAIARKALHRAGG